jgi:hypothetical protein
LATATAFEPRCFLMPRPWAGAVDARDAPDVLEAVLDERDVLEVDRRAVDFATTIRRRSSRSSASPRRAR